MLRQVFFHTTFSHAKNSLLNAQMYIDIYFFCNYFFIASLLVYLYIVEVIFVI